MTASAQRRDIPIKRHLARIAAALAVALPVVLAPILSGLAMPPAQVQPEIAGRIEGEDVQVTGAIGVEEIAGRRLFTLASGSQVNVRSGQARILLAEGGELGICGPANLTLLKSGGATTVALNYGRVHARMANPGPLVVYTPLIVAIPIEINGARDATIGLQPDGAMCALSTQGALRVEQQLTGQSLLVPRGGEITLAGGQLDAVRGSRGSCGCDVLLADRRVEPKQVEVSRVVSPGSARPVAPAPNLAGPAKSPARRLDDPKAPAVGEPVWQVLMPPLTFDATSPARPPEPSPETILLVRQARVRPVKVFRGRVEAAPEPPAPAVQLAQVVPLPTNKTTKSAPSFGERVRDFFRRLLAR